MYGIFTNIWVIYGVNAGKYSIDGAYGIWAYDMEIIRQNIGFRF
jgi:hypothetical protein